MLQPPPDHSPSQPVVERYDPLRVLGILLIPCVLLTVGLALWVLATHDGPGPRLAVAYEPVVTTDAPDAPDAFVPAAPRDPASAVRHQLLRSAFEDDLAMLRAPRRSLVAPDAGRDRTYIAYTVELGDTVSALAERYGVSAASIVASNVHIEREDELHAGVGILIPVAEGVLYGVSEGDTLESIAALYGSSAESIAAFPGNRIADPDQLPVGTLVLIPGGHAPVARGVPAVSPISPSFPLPPAGIAAVAALPGVASGIWLWPVDSHRITSQYGPRHPLGIDVGASMRSPIYAASAGRVVFAGGDPCCSYGYYMDVDHGGGYRTRYAHVDEFRVGVGTMVASGQVIGLTGNNGRSTGPHLHFEVLRHGVQVDPMTYLGSAFVPAPVALVQALPTGARAKKNTPSLAGGGSGRGGPDVTAISWRTTAADPAREVAAQAEADRRSAARAAEREAESVRRAQERLERDALRSAQAAAQAAERQRLDDERAQRAEERAAARAAEAARIAEAGRLRNEARAAARAEREFEAARLAEERRLHDEAEVARLALERTEREEARAAERLAAREATAA
ncbi:MAG: M23 family metallopeptidase, partial [Dehalococcoidia bacterium]